MKAAGAASVAGSLGFPNILRAQNQGDKLRVAFVGVGGIGGQHTGFASKAGDICNCFCDVDEGRWGNANNPERWPKAKGYRNYREMYEKEKDNFDAVMVGTPDHTHYPAAILAMQMGKHVYCQKPLTHTVWEARQLRLAAKKYGVATQMGNQGHANEGNRKMVEWVQSGILGDIKEVHCFTNRPVWPQGMQTPTGKDPIPASIDWDAWLGTAPQRDFVAKYPDNWPDADLRGKEVYAPFVWRGWWDFGGGALADMACHTMDCVWWALDPVAPSSVEVIARSPMTNDNFPKASVIRFEFPANGDRPAFTGYWYDGDLFPGKPGTELLGLSRRLPGTGAMFVGTQAGILSSGDYGDRPRLIPETFHKENAQSVPPSIPRAPEEFKADTTFWHYHQWRDAAMGKAPADSPGSHFGYAAPFSETVLLANVALKMNTKLQWDSEKLEVTNVPEANQYVKKGYERPGWTLKDLGIEVLS